MTTRPLTTEECFRLIDSLQAVHLNIDDAVQRLGFQPSEALAQLASIIAPINGVIVKLQEQSQQNFVPAVQPKMVPGGITPAKYHNTIAEFDLTDDEWAIADQWNGVYNDLPDSFYKQVIL